VAKQCRLDREARSAEKRTASKALMLGAMATVLDSLNPIRNNASVAHPNEELLDELEAHVAINADLLGHSSIAVTGDVYGHTSDNTARAAVDVLADQLGLLDL
jgi:hypothetical protein